MCERERRDGRRGRGGVDLLIPVAWVHLLPKNRSSRHFSPVVPCAHCQPCCGHEDHTIHAWVCLDCWNRLISRRSFFISMTRPPAVPFRHLTYLRKYSTDCPALHTSQSFASGMKKSARSMSSQSPSTWDCSFSLAMRSTYFWAPCCRLLRLRHLLSSSPLFVLQALRVPCTKARGSCTHLHSSLTILSREGAGGLFKLGLG